MLRNNTYNNSSDANNAVFVVIISTLLDITESRNVTYCIQKRSVHLKNVRISDSLSYDTRGRHFRNNAAMIFVGTVITCTVYPSHRYGFNVDFSLSLTKECLFILCKSAT